MQRCHPVLAHGIRFGEAACALAMVSSSRCEISRLALPGFRIRFAHNHVQANTKTYFATMRRRFGAHLSYFL
jgi:hypothetical protein